MTANNIYQELIKRVVGAVIFGVAVYIILYAQCQKAGPGLCYMAPQAWLYIPAMAAVPGALIQLFSWLSLLALAKNQHSYVALRIVVHAAISFALLRLWLLVTGQQWLSPPSIDGDLFIVLAGATMGGFLALWRSNPSFKGDALKRAP